MAEQAFGGDDDSSTPVQEAPKPKKLDLKKYASTPDANVRDIFWSIMGSYATKSEVNAQYITSLDNHQNSIIRIALSELAKEEKSYYGLSKNFIAMYTLMLILDQSWEELFAYFIIESYSMKNKPIKSIGIALKRLESHEKYANIIESNFSQMIRDNTAMSAILAYLIEIKNISIIKKLKKELMIIARNDIEQNQHNAILCLAMLVNDSDLDAKNLILQLLSHWDVETRRLIAYILKEYTQDGTVVEAVKRQIQLETDEDVRKAFDKIIGNKSMESKALKKQVAKLKESVQGVKRLRYSK
ncbi:MAG: hypothetical protein AABX38_00915 [Candidatus Micrarchaeota archaeon]